MKFGDFLKVFILDFFGFFFKFWSLKCFALKVVVKIKFGHFHNENDEKK